MKLFNVLIMFYASIFCLTLFANDVGENPFDTSIDPNSLDAGMADFFDATNHLLIGGNQVAGVNHLCDAILNFFIIAAKRAKTDDKAVEKISELITKFRYLITTRMKQYNYKAFDDKFSESVRNFPANTGLNKIENLATGLPTNEEIIERQKIAEILKRIYSSSFNMLIHPTQFGVHLKDIFSDLLKITSLVFSDGKIDKQDFEKVQGALDGVMNVYRLITRNKDAGNNLDTIVNLTGISNPTEITSKSDSNLQEQKAIAKAFSEIYNGIISMILNNNAGIDCLKSVYKGLLSIASAVFEDGKIDKQDLANIQAGFVGSITQKA